MPTAGEIFGGIYNASNEDMAKLNLAIQYLSRDPEGAQLLQEMAAAQPNLVINHSFTNDYQSLNRVIDWDPGSGLIVQDAAGNQLGYGSAAANLLHEGAHAVDPNFVTNANVKDAQFDNAADRYAIERVNKAVDSLGELPRETHSDAQAGMANPTLHTQGSTWVEMDGSGNIVSQGGYAGSGAQPEGSYNFGDQYYYEPSPYTYDPYEPIGDPGLDYNGDWQKDYEYEEAWCVTSGPVVAKSFQPSPKDGVILTKADHAAPAEGIEAIFGFKTAAEGAAQLAGDTLDFQRAGSGIANNVVVDGGEVLNGCLHFTGTGPQNLSGALHIAALAAETSGETLVFELAGNAYVFQQGCATVAELVGVGHVSLLGSSNPGEFFVG